MSNDTQPLGEHEFFNLIPNFCVYQAIELLNRLVKKTIEDSTEDVGTNLKSFWAINKAKLNYWFITETHIREMWNDLRLHKTDILDVIVNIQVQMYSYLGETAITEVIKALSYGYGYQKKHATKSFSDDVYNQNAVAVNEFHTYLESNAWLLILVLFQRVDKSVFKFVLEKPKE